jgi:hypothetical protein
MTHNVERVAASGGFIAPQPHVCTKVNRIIVVQNLFCCHHCSKTLLAAVLRSALI